MSASVHPLYALSLTHPPTHPHTHTHTHTHTWSTARGWPELSCTHKYVRLYVCFCSSTSCSLSLTSTHTHTHTLTLTHSHTLTHTCCPLPEPYLTSCEWSLSLDSTLAIFTTDPQVTCWNPVPHSKTHTHTYTCTTHNTHTHTCRCGGMKNYRYDGKH